jgi:hypothetical protein
LGKVCFAVLAHDFRECVEDLIENLYYFEPECQIVLFNGGTVPSLFEGLNVLHCPYSFPIKYRKPQKSTILMMRWVTEQKMDYDYFVLVDHDMLLIRKGFSSFLDREMADSAYMGQLKGKNGLITEDLNWRPGLKFLRDWHNGWSEIFKLPAPYGCFNPGQVFRKSYVENFLRFENLDQLIQQIDQSKLSSLGEIIFPTMAQVLNSPPLHLPYHDKAIRYRKPHIYKEIKYFLEAEDIYFVHPVPMDWHTPIRQFIRLLKGQQTDNALDLDWGIDDIDYDYSPYRKDRS